MASGGDNYSEDRGGRPMRQEEPEERTDGWMATYADMVTLLLTFFVLMFAISNVDSQKAMLFFAGLSAEGLSVERFMEIQQMHAEPGEDDHVGDNLVLPEDEPNYDEIEEIINQQLMDMFQAIVDYIDTYNLGDSMAVELDGDFIVVTLPGDIFFATAMANITDEMREIAGTLGQLIATQHTVQYPFEIIVTGHTDNVPINTVEFQSNWRLSAVRAMNFLEVLLEYSDIDPRYFSSRGYGEYHPVGDNNTPEGRQQNRRVEVMITPLRETSEGRTRLG
jgi:chemotaxis protein MotB